MSVNPHKLLPLSVELGARLQPAQQLLIKLRLLTGCLLIAFLSTACGTTHFSAEERAASIRTTSLQAPSFALKDTQGRTFALNHFRGKPVMLVFWAPWCKACRLVMPEIQDIFETTGPEVMPIVAVAQEPDFGKVAQYEKEAQFTFPSLVDETGLVSELYGASTLPLVYFLDPDGNAIEVNLPSGKWQIRVRGSDPELEMISLMIAEHYCSQTTNAPGRASICTKFLVR